MPKEMLERKPRPTEDIVYIDEQDRLTIIARMKSKGVTRAQLGRDCDVSGAAITQLLKPIHKGKTRACRYSSKLQRALDFELTGKVPAAIPREVSRRTQKIIKSLLNDPDELEYWLQGGERSGERNAKRASEPTQSSQSALSTRRALRLVTDD